MYVVDAIYKANREIERYDNIVCSISGGSESDIMIDLLFGAAKGTATHINRCATGKEKSCYGYTWRYI